MHIKAFSILYLILITVFVGTNTSSGTLWISEFMASNSEGIKDSDGDSSDWIEIYNDGNLPVGLGGWRLTDDATDSSKWVFPNIVIPSKGYLVVFASDENSRSARGELHTKFKLSKSGEYLALIKPDGSVGHSYGPSFPPQITDVSYGVDEVKTSSAIITQGAAGRAGVPTSLADYNTNFNGWNTSVNGVFTGSTWKAVNSGVGYERYSEFGSLIGMNGDFDDGMYNGNTSVFLRIPFNVVDKNTVDSLTLRMKWDSGFVAYVNGVEVAADRKPTSLTWNSASTSDRPDSQNDDWVDFNIDMSQIALTDGNNLLAIHGLNDKANSSDMLCLPSLDIVTISTLGAEKNYFLEPSPEGKNNFGVTNLPPLLVDVTDSVGNLPQGGVGSAPIKVTAKVQQTHHPVTSVKVYYRVMYDAESQVTMLDNGVAPDTVAGDGIYSANVPTTGMTAGQMIRWRVAATDTQNNINDAPSFLDPLDADEYYGTIADPRITTSNLTILHWFVESPTSANTRGGTRSSFYYLGKFYDNIQTDLHGQSTTGFAKKSFDLDFNKGNRFEWEDGEIKAKDINLLTNWADKTKVRNTMAYEVFRDAGAAHHYAFPVRVEQNGAFFSIADMVEDGDDHFLERIGFDPEGALYKMYNSIDGLAGGIKKDAERRR